MTLRLLLLTLFVAMSSSLVAQQTYIHAGSLFDGTGEQMRSNVTIIVDDGRIVDVRDGLLNPDSESVLIDLSDKTVLPGFIDLHVHLENETGPDRYLDRFTKNPEDIAFESSRNAKKTLLAGFTTVRDLGGTGVNTSLRDAIRTGYVDGPRVISVGKSLATTGGHADPTNSFKRELMGNPGPESGVVNGADEAREAVRQNYKLGVDHIKITSTGGVLSVAKSGQNPQFMEDELEAIIETARDYEMHVAAHAHGKEGMLRAVKAGVHTIEHGTYMDEEVMQAMVDNDTYYVPTITAGKFVAEKAEVEGYYPPLVVPKAREIGPLIQNTFGEAYRYGVKIAFGTDAGVFHHGDNAKEFGFMVEAGMPEIEALLSATQTASVVLGLENEIGSIEAGKSADIIAVSGNPLSDISVLENVNFVMKEGIVYKSE
ncbi:metal-dependent hydrolase family protein [Rhodohalobacter barkolensis]|uniref:Amidohydrolase n=1 Tax=Rhodohalobacter barkolensis TaxID=2053187 RepID=A0A2N0VE03_9BACT|nr:amidohydrolase family protein [Rhodohalobacter barkolensis]PKD42421.1 amidohydrolase [Rhodohalobacter barkolensis]